MKELYVPTPGEIVVLHTPPREALLSLVARLALGGPLLVLDAGNEFDAYRVARLIGRRTRHVDRVLKQVHVARAFTCYQVVALFEQLPATPMPHVILDLPATFYDESVPPAESRRLLRLVLQHVARLRQGAPLVISVRPIRTRWSPRNGPVNPRADLLTAILELADHLFTWEIPDAAAPVRLF